jgi:hypothetical protein
MHDLVFPMLPAPSGGSRGREHLRARSGLAGRFWSQLGEDRPQGLDASRERVTIISGDVGKLFDQGDGFFVG